MQRYAGRDACEGEVLAGHVLAFSRFYRTSKEKTDTARENMSASLCALRAQLRRTFWEKIGGSDPLLPLSPSKRAEYLLAARDRMDASLDRSRSLGTPQGVATGPEGLVAAEGPAAAPPTPTPSGASPPPEPLRWVFIRLTQASIRRADDNQGRRNLWLRLLDRLGLGFDS